MSSSRGMFTGLSLTCVNIQPIHNMIEEFNPPSEAHLLHHGWGPLANNATHKHFMQTQSCHKANLSSPVVTTKLALWQLLGFGECLFHKHFYPIWFAKDDLDLTVPAFIVRKAGSLTRTPNAESPILEFLLEPAFLALNRSGNVPLQFYINSFVRAVFKIQSISISMSVPFEIFRRLRTIPISCHMQSLWDIWSHGLK